MSYTPNPIDTSHIELSSAIREFTERLAEHAHGVWAAERLSQGWTFGPSHDDAAKTDPYLVPFTELPDSEKGSHRNAALGTLKAMLALGYRIETGAMPETCQVDFTASVSAMLPLQLRSQLEQELREIFSKDGAADWVLVSRSFGGYSPNYALKVVLGVEVRRTDGYETHIVKLGASSNVSPDAEGWKDCTRDRQVASRILAPVEHVAGLDGDRAAVLYRDAYILFGLERESGRPEMLETAAEWAVRDDRPCPLSVERAVAHIFTDLGRWFFPGATEDAASAWAFYRERLHIAKRCAEPAEMTPPETILDMWNSQQGRQLLRRDAVWLICGRDKPDADPVREPARYLDPVDFVAWTMDARNMESLPDTLVGRSHGDLHGRNVLVGVRRGEVEYPALFDYGEMRSDNVLAWDFAKLETELKVRLLTALLADSAVRQKLLSLNRSMNLRKQPEGLPSQGFERAERMAMFLAFEEWLHELTSRIHSREQAEALTPLPPDYRTGVDKLDRLVAILLRIRKEAALWLGFERHQRREKWRDELYFALSVYGLLNIRWDYDIPQSECALIAAGVAAARMRSTPTLLEACVQRGATAPGNDPSYRVPLSLIHGHWKARHYDLGKSIVDQVVFISDENERGEITSIRIRPEVAHAIPLIAEGALLEIECGLARLAEGVLDSLRIPAREFGDFETLGRLGRLFKDAGDQRWDETSTASSNRPTGSAAQLYAKSLTIYVEAFLASEDYYTGINAATLALLTGDSASARDHAEKVAKLCEKMTDIPRNDRFWVFATEGEAKLIIENWEKSRQYYHDALAELTPGQGGMANSSYKQVCRLWKVLGAPVEEVLKVFELSDFRFSLTPLLGRVMADTK
jgi:hypothetical protein